MPGLGNIFAFSALALLSTGVTSSLIHVTVDASTSFCALLLLEEVQLEILTPVVGSLDRTRQWVGFERS